jgi:hypothetical protein
MMMSTEGAVVVPPTPLLPTFCTAAAADNAPAPAASDALIVLPLFMPRSMEPLCLDAARRSWSLGMTQTGLIAWLKVARKKHCSMT